MSKTAEKSFMELRVALGDLFMAIIKGLKIDHLTERLDSWLRKFNIEED